MIAVWRPPTPLPDTPPPPGTPFEDPNDEDPWPERETGKPGLGKPELMGASSGGWGEMPFIPGVNPITPGAAEKMKEQTAKVREQFAKNKAEWEEREKKDPGFKSRMVGMRVSHHKVTTQPKSEFNKAFWKQVGWDIVKQVAKWTGIAVAAVYTGGLLVAGAISGGLTAALSSMVASWVMGIRGLFYTLGCSAVAAQMITWIETRFPGVMLNCGRIGSRMQGARPIIGITRWFSRYSWDWHHFAVINQRFIIDPVRFWLPDVIITRGGIEILEKSMAG